MTASRARKVERKQAIAAARDRRGEFTVTSFGRQRSQGRGAPIGTLLLLLSWPVIYLYQRIRRKPA